MRAIIITGLLLAGTTSFAAENRFEAPASTLSPLSTAAEISEALDINCDTLPGRTFCRDLRQFDSLLLNCTGAACYSVWDAQLNKIDDIENWFDNNLFRGDVVAYELGDDSRAVAMRLCAVRLTGDARYVTAMAIGYNNLLAVLNDVQEMAGVRIPYTCRFNIN